MKPKPLVSIIMPAYNAEKYLTNAIRSVLEQSYQNLELLIIDDNSTDSTRLIAQGISDQRVKYYRTERLGRPARVRNLGLHLAQGDFLAFLDSDDEMFPDAVEKLLEALLAEPRWLGVQGFFLHVDENLSPRETGNHLIQKNEGTWCLPEFYQHTLLHMLKKKTVHGLPSLLIRKEALSEIGFLNEGLHFSEDYEYFLRLASKGFDRLGLIPAYICKYRLNPNSHTHGNNVGLAWLQTNLEILAWAEAQPSFQQIFGEFGADIYFQRYRDVCAWQVNTGHPDTALKVFLLVLKDSRVPSLYWPLFLPVLLRAAIPGAFQKFLVSLAWKIRYLKYA